MSDADDLFRFLSKLGKEVVESAEEAAVEQAGKEYRNETFAFELTVPSDALHLRAATPPSPLEEVARTVASVVAPSAGPIEWQVVAALEIPWGRNLTGAVDVAVTS